MTDWAQYDSLLDRTEGLAVDASATPEMKLAGIRELLNHPRAYEYEGLAWSATAAVAQLAGLVQPGEYWYGPPEVTT